MKPRPKSPCRCPSRQSLTVSLTWPVVNPGPGLAVPPRNFGALNTTRTWPTVSGAAPLAITARLQKTPRTWAYGCSRATTRITYTSLSGCRMTSSPRTAPRRNPKTAKPGWMTAWRFLSMATTATSPRGIPAGQTPTSSVPAASS